MSLISIKGFYRGGQIELTECPDGLQESPVIVTFLAEPAPEVDRETLRKRFFERMRQGIDFGGTIPTREEIYAERLGRFDESAG